MIETEFENKIGVNAESIGRCCYATYSKLSGVPCEETEGNIERWTEASELVFHVCNNQIETSFKELSGKFFSRLNAGELSQKPRAVQLLVEAVVRQGVNLITAEDREDFDEARDFDWRPWLLERLKHDRVSDAGS